MAAGELLIKEAPPGTIPTTGELLLIKKGTTVNFFTYFKGSLTAFPSLEELKPGIELGREIRTQEDTKIDQSLRNSPEI